MRSGGPEVAVAELFARTTGPEGPTSRRPGAPALAESASLRLDSIIPSVTFANTQSRTTTSVTPVPDGDVVTPRVEPAVCHAPVSTRRLSKVSQLCDAIEMPPVTFARPVPKLPYVIGE